MTEQRTILGIDPGTNILGFGVVCVDERGKCAYVDMGTLDLRKEKDPYAKLLRINEFVTSLCDSYLPSDLAIESPFMDKNAQVILKLGRAQSAVMLAAASRDIPITEYPPRQVKTAVCGYGAASKQQVGTMARKILGIKIEEKFFDATDALAVALCHYFHLTSPLTSTSSVTSWEKFVKENPNRINKK